MHSSTFKQSGSLRYTPQRKVTSCSSSQTSNEETRRLRSHWKLTWVDERVSGGQKTKGDGSWSFLRVGQSVAWSSAGISVGAKSVCMLHQRFTAGNYVLSIYVCWRHQAFQRIQHRRKQGRVAERCRSPKWVDGEMAAEVQCGKVLGYVLWRSHKFENSRPIQNGAVEQQTWLPCKKQWLRRIWVSGWQTT